MDLVFSVKLIVKPHFKDLGLFIGLIIDVAIGSEIMYIRSNIKRKMKIINHPEQGYSIVDNEGIVFVSANDELEPDQEYLEFFCSILPSEFDEEEVKKHSSHGYALMYLKAEIQYLQVLHDTLEQYPDIEVEGNWYPTDGDIDLIFKVPIKYLPND